MIGTIFAAFFVCTLLGVFIVIRFWALFLSLAVAALPRSQLDKYFPTQLGSLFKSGIPTLQRLVVLFLRMIHHSTSQQFGVARETVVSLSTSGGGTAAADSRGRPPQPPNLTALTPCGNVVLNVLPHDGKLESIAKNVRIFEAIVSVLVTGRTAEIARQMAQLLAADLTDECVQSATELFTAPRDSIPYLFFALVRACSNVLHDAEFAAAFGIVLREYSAALATATSTRAADAEATFALDTASLLLAVGSTGRPVQDLSRDIAARLSDRVVAHFEPVLREPRTSALKILFECLALWRACNAEQKRAILGAVVLFTTSNRHPGAVPIATAIVVATLDALESVVLAESAEGARAQQLLQFVIHDALSDQLLPHHITAPRANLCPVVIQFFQLHRCCRNYRDSLLCSSSATPADSAIASASASAAAIPPDSPADASSSPPAAADMAALHAASVASGCQPLEDTCGALLRAVIAQLNLSARPAAAASTSTSVKNSASDAGNDAAAELQQFINAVTALLQSPDAAVANAALRFLQGLRSCADEQLLSVLPNF